MEALSGAIKAGGLSALQTLILVLLMGGWCRCGLCQTRSLQCERQPQSLLTQRVRAIPSSHLARDVFEAAQHKITPQLNPALTPEPQTPNPNLDTNPTQHIQTPHPQPCTISPPPLVDRYPGMRTVKFKPTARSLNLDPSTRNAEASSLHADSYLDG